MEEQDHTHRSKVLSDAVHFRRKVVEPAQVAKELLNREKQQHRREDMLARAFVHSAMPAVLCKVVRDHLGEPHGYEIIEASESFGRLVDRPASELPGQRLLEVLKWAEDQLRGVCRETARKGVAALAVARRDDPRAWWRVSVVKTHPDELLLNFADITDETRRRVDAESERSLYLDVLRVEDALVCRYGPDGTVTYANDAYRRAFPETDAILLAHSFLPSIPKEDRDMVAKLHKSLSPRNTSVTYEHRIEVGGNVRWHEWTDAVILNDHGLVDGYQATGRDVTGRKAAELESGEAQARPAGGLALHRDVATGAGKHERPKGGLHKRLVEGESLTICGDCKRVLDENDHWLPLETYMNTYVGVKVRPSICPYCKRKNFPGLYSE